MHPALDVRANLAVEAATGDPWASRTESGCPVQPDLERHIRSGIDCRPAGQASHIGLGMNPVALYAMAERLSQPEGRWTRFHRNGWRQWLYLDPARAADRYF